MKIVSRFTFAFGQLPKRSVVVAQWPVISAETVAAHHASLRSLKTGTCLAVAMNHVARLLVVDVYAVHFVDWREAGQKFLPTVAAAILRWLMLIWRRRLLWSCAPEIVWQWAVTVVTLETYLAKSGFIRIFVWRIACQHINWNIWSAFGIYKRKPFLLFLCELFQKENFFKLKLQQINKCFIDFFDPVRY